MKYLFIYLSIFYSAYAEYELKFFKSANRVEIENKFNILESELRKNQLDELEKKEILDVLLILKDDPRGEFELSDQVIPPVRWRALILMAIISGYDKVLAEAKNIDPSQPFTEDPFNYFKEKDFLRWFEDNRISRAIEGRFNERNQYGRGSSDLEPLTTTDVVIEGNGLLVESENMGAGPSLLANKGKVTYFWLISVFLFLGIFTCLVVNRLGKRRH